MTTGSSKYSFNLPLSSSQIQQLKSMGIEPALFIDSINGASTFDEVAKVCNVSREKVDQAYKMLSSNSIQ